MNPKLLEAVAIFKDLGWEAATPENIMSLPLGTAEQQKIALTGLQSGEWGAMVLISPPGSLGQTWAWSSYVDVDSGRLALFAVRLGVDVKRAIKFLRPGSGTMIDEVIVARGPKYTSDFIRLACDGRGRSNFTAPFGFAAVRLVARLNLDIPQSLGYIYDWSACAAAVLGLTEYKYLRLHDDPALPGVDLIESRFLEHLKTGVSVNAPADNLFVTLFIIGLKRGLLTRKEAWELGFLALDSAVRSSDRKVWLELLMGHLGVGDEELCARAQSLIPLLASGDAVMVKKLAPILIEKTESALLIELLLACLSVTVKKTRRMLLEAALRREAPANALELAEWLAILVDDKDKGIAALAAKLISHWGLGAAIVPVPTNEARGLWRQTPPVWQVPPFELGEVTPQALTEMAATMTNLTAVIHDVNAERFLALANAVAWRDPAAARASLRGLSRHGWILSDVRDWVQRKEPSWNFAHKDVISRLLMERDYTVCANLDKLPCILSTPSRLDLSVTVPDLVDRLARYRERSLNVLEADLLLAVTRLDRSTRTPESDHALKGLDIPITLESGEKMPTAAGETVLSYLNAPAAQEPPLFVSVRGRWAVSRQNLPPRLGYHQRAELFSVCPHWGDAALRKVKWDYPIYYDHGLFLRQAARRATPLPPGAAINFLAEQRNMEPHAAADARLAVQEAWERGLLRPGVADIAYMDWKTDRPDKLAALAAILESLAQDGLLSVVWPILDALISLSLKEAKMLAGTAELAQLTLDFLPEVFQAVESGLAVEEALALPGVRALADRPGASRAASAARKVAAQLPPAPENPAPLLNPPFEKIWLEYGNEKPIVEDGATIEVDWATHINHARLLLFTLILPGVEDRTYHIVMNGGRYNTTFNGDGQCRAYVCFPGENPDAYNNKIVWLYWDEERQSIAVRDRRILTDQGSPMSLAFLTVSVGFLAQDGYADESILDIFTKTVYSGQMCSKVVRRAVQTLFKSPAVSPAKLVRILEKNIGLLHILWPLLTESVKEAAALVAANEAPPPWLDSILDVAQRYAPYLAEAAKRGLIPPEDAQWAGLSDIAALTSQSAAVQKAIKLTETLHLR